ncbi:MAG TPA: hypothetical protein DCY07_01920, partial [Rhodospirillaceae bacterium]|nr:hypothetical protein [Rhodospirillaceae bacterium]
FTKFRGWADRLKFTFTPRINVNDLLISNGYQDFNQAYATPFVGVSLCFLAIFLIARFVFGVRAMQSPHPNKKPAVLANGGLVCL